MKPAPNIHTNKKTQRIALVGGAQSTQADAPFKDELWQVWSLVSHAAYIPRCDLWFEIHDDLKWPLDYQYAVKQLSPKIMAPAQAKKYKAKPFPYSLARGLAGGRLMLTSSLDHMMALAISKKPKQIGVWGFDLCDDEEYVGQREGFRFWQGVAIAKGIDVVIPDVSALGGDLPLYGAEGYKRKAPAGTEDSFTRLLKSVVVQAKEAMAGVYKNDDEKVKALSQWCYMTALYADSYSAFRRGADVSKNIKIIDNRLNGENAA